eukprot:3173566-Prymnesium_polylepis.1
MTGGVGWGCGVSGYESVCEGVCECPWKCMAGRGRGVPMGVVGYGVGKQYGWVATWYVEGAGVRRGAHGRTDGYVGRVRGSESIHDHVIA